MKLETKNLFVNIDGNEILKNIDLQVGNNEFVGVIGANGSGKSTLLRCIYRMISPKSGEILLDNKSIKTISLRETAKKIAVVSQHNDVNFDFTVKDMVEMGRTPYKKIMESFNQEDRKITKEVLMQVGLEEYENRSFTSLSGGEQQRVILARALAQKTDFLILDEPTNHLDINYQLQFFSAVEKLDIGVIAAIHDLNIAGMYCRKLYALKDNKIMCYGTPKEVLTKENIKEIFNVDADIIENKEDGTITVIYKKTKI